jgi:phenylalanyl-tRNA synthetase beta chain
MRDLGFHGVVTLSLTDPGMAGRLRLVSPDSRADAIRVSNPLSVDQSVMRTTLLGTLLDAVRYNHAHGAAGVALFESGRAYLRDGERGDSPQAGAFAGRRASPAYEPQRIAAIATGSLRAADWRGGAAPADFYALKGSLEALAGQLGSSVVVEAGAEPFLHPGRAATVLLGGTPAGWLGELHPLVCRAWDLETAVGFEVDLAALFAGSNHGVEAYEDVSTYPAVEQDLAVVVADDVAAASVEAAVRDAGGELLRSVELFDLYTGEQVGEGRKSLALRLEFRATDRTLTDAEVAERRDAIKAALAQIGGALRE